jgi:hypothetical protein
MINWLGYLLGGKVLIFLWQLFPLPHKLEENKTIHKLHICDLCSGVYLFTLLAFVFHVSLLTLFGVSYIFIISEFLTGAIVSFLVHLISLGWKTKFEVVVLE